MSNRCPPVLFRYCIGALDRETGVMTLHRTELVTMQPHIPGGWVQVGGGLKTGKGVLKYKHCHVV